MSVVATEKELALVQVVVIAILKEAQKTGWSWSDLPAFLKSPDFDGAVVAAVSAAPAVPGELTSLSLLDDLELGKYCYGMAQSILAELKKVKSTAVAA